VAAAAVTVVATAEALVHRLTAADQPSTARAELDRQPGVGAAHNCATVSHTSGPQCFRTTAQGTGLGLAIAVGQARLPSAEPVLRNRPEGRAQAVLSFMASVAG
jgi:hypothetical protein